MPISTLYNSKLLILKNHFNTNKLTTMTRLFLLKPGFTDKNIDDHTKFYCPDCAMIQGIISLYPKLKELIEIIYVDFERPRKKLIEYVGEENQGCPCLVISKQEINGNINTSYFKNYSDYLFINSTAEIAQYLSDKFGIGVPHP